MTIARRVLILCCVLVLFAAGAPSMPAARPILFGDIEASSGNGWVAMGELKPGERLLLAGGQAATATAVRIERLADPVTVYNFEVADWHTYHVGSQEAGWVFVHNLCKPRAYSVAFETSIPKVGAGTRPAHFKAANEVLLAQMKTSPQMAKMMKRLRIKVPVNGKGVPIGESPKNWTWHHHPTREGVLQLVPTGQHQSGRFRHLFHPGGVGGFKLWGKKY